MKKISILLALVVLILSSLACQTILGGGNDNSPIDSGGVEAPTSPPADSGGGLSVGGDSEFPMPDDATNVLNLGDDVLNFQTKLSLQDTMGFYREEFGKSDYKERAELTVTTDTTFSMVFDGHASGKPITVQGVDLADGTINISITLADF